MATMRHRRDPDAKVCELGGDASLPSSACIAFLRLAPFHKTGADFGSGNYLNFCTSWLRRFVPDLEVWYLSLKAPLTECTAHKSPTNNSTLAYTKRRTTRSRRMNRVLIWIYKIIYLHSDHLSVLPTHTTYTMTYTFVNTWLVKSSKHVRLKKRSWPQWNTVKPDPKFQETSSPVRRNISIFVCWILASGGLARRPDSTVPPYVFPVPVPTPWLHDTEGSSWSRVHSLLETAQEAVTIVTHDGSNWAQ